MAKQRSFEALMAELDRLVEKLEKPDTGLEESLRLFESGNRLITEARQRLQTLEHEFEIIQKKFGEETTDPQISTDTTDTNQTQGTLLHVNGD